MSKASRTYAKPARLGLVAIAAALLATAAGPATAHAAVLEAEVANASGTTGAQGAIFSTPEGIECAAAPPVFGCSADFQSDSHVTLTAVSARGYALSHFSSNCTPIAGTQQCTTQMDQATKRVTAFFAFTATTPRLLTVATAGGGEGRVKSVVQGIDCANPLVAPSDDCTESYDGGTTVTLVATPSAGSAFQGFSPNCAPLADQPTRCVVSLDAAKTVTATFAPPSRHTIDIDTAGTGQGRVDSAPTGITCLRSTVAPPIDCSEDFISGTVVTLTATPITTDPVRYSRFKGFSSNCTPVPGQPTQCTVTADADKRVLAEFENSRKLDVGLAGTGTGRVVSSPSGISCGSTCSAEFATGTDVVLVAEPSGDSIFRGFSSGCAPFAALPRACSVRMDTANSVTATFDRPTGAINDNTIGALVAAARSSDEAEVLAAEIRSALGAALDKAKNKVQNKADALAEARREAEKTAVAIAQRDYEAAKAARDALLPAIRATQKAQTSAGELNRLLQAVASDPSPANQAAVKAQIPTFRDDFRVAAAKTGVAAISDKLPNSIALLLAVFAPNIKEVGEQTLQEVLEAGFELALGNPQRLVALVSKARTTVDGLGERFDKKFSALSPEDRKGFAGGMRLIYTGLDLEFEILSDAVAAGLNQNKEKLTKLYADAKEVNEQLKRKIQGAVKDLIEDEVTKKTIAATKAAVDTAVTEAKKVANKILDVF